MNVKLFAAALLATIAVGCSPSNNFPPYVGHELWLRDLGKSQVVVIAQDSNAIIGNAITELSSTHLADTFILRLEPYADIHRDTYSIDLQDNTATITAQTPIGLLYAAFYVRTLEATQRSLPQHVTETPDYDLRMLNHWDNLDGTIERGYAGHSLWKWNELPAKISPRYAEYARACASVGINATVLNNVNASPQILTNEYIAKVAAIAGVLRQYGVRVFLSVNFASPMMLDSLADADPLRDEVRLWWQRKADDIYALIPDFGGFLVKANSEGLPGPLDYKRTHADGANMLAEALQPHGGLVLWRAFVYSPSDADRAKQAFLEFTPYDGKFADNVIIQIKNGPIDFQPREPFSPLFGAMPHSHQMVELQITQEYTGFSNHLCYLHPLWREALDSDTYRCGEGSTVANVTQGKYERNRVTPTAIAGVANTGDTLNWCGHPIAAANWYAFGRMAWNTRLSSDSIAREWLNLTIPDLPVHACEVVDSMMLASREAIVDYMMPLGLHHLFAWGHHYGPEPWCNIDGARPDWMPSYYHRADSVGIGFDRSPDGSNACAQYAEPLASIYGDINMCPDEYLLWFHHASWNHTMHSGRTLWAELCYRYARGLETAERMEAQWNALQGEICEPMWSEVSTRLAVQCDDARWWHDACLLYFQRYSQQDIPQPTRYSLDEMQHFKLDISNFECPPHGYRPRE